MTNTETASRPAPHAFERAGLGVAPFRCVGYNYAVYQACPGAPLQVGTSCDYCGTGIKHVYLIVDSKGNSFKVGSECVRKTSDRTLVATARTFRRDAARAKRRAEIAEERAAWAAAARADTLAQNPDLVDLLKTDHPVVKDMAARFEKFGSLSAKQIDYLRVLKGRAVTNLCDVPATDKRVDLQGVIASVKAADDYFAGGMSYKMLVLVTTDAGQYKLWGTVPSVLFIGNTVETLRGKTVSFSAKIQRSNKDASFGFFSRPTKAQVIA